MGVEAMLVGAALGAVTAGALQKPPKPPKLEAPTPPPKPPQLPQSAAAPIAAMRGANAATAGATGPSSTLLTGPNGLAPSATNLGKSTLLGQ